MCTTIIEGIHVHNSVVESYGATTLFVPAVKASINSNTPLQSLDAIGDVKITHTHTHAQCTHTHHKFTMHTHTHVCTHTLSQALH